MTCIAQISEMRSENFIFVFYKLFIFYFFVIETVNSRQVFQFFKIPIFKFHLLIFVFYLDDESSVTRLHKLCILYNIAFNIQVIPIIAENKRQD